MSTDLRATTLSDAATLARLHAACFEEAWSEAAFRKFLGDPLVIALLAGTANASQSFILVRVAADEGEILTLGTAPSARRQGHAQRLVKAASAQAYDSGARAMFLEVAADNDAALMLYGKLGFAHTGRRPGYYPRSGRPAADALMLRAFLPL